MHSNEISSLINLLDDTDPDVLAVVTSQLCAKGEEALPLLESAWRSAIDGEQLARIERVMAHIRESAAIRQLKEWVKRGAPDMLTGAYLVTSLFRPNAELERIQEQLAALNREVWVELHSHLTALEQVRIVNHVLYGVHKFAGRRMIDSDRLLLLSDLLQSREGCQISLALLYCCLAEQLALHIAGINHPDSGMLGYVDQRGGGDILFFIDPHNGGLCGKQQLAQAMTQLAGTPKAAERYLVPCSRKALVQRYARFLHLLYHSANKPEQAAKASRAVKILR